jgi:hypothetical protein
MKRHANTLNKITWFFHSKFIRILSTPSWGEAFQWKNTAWLMKWWWFMLPNHLKIKMKANRLQPFKSVTLFQSCAKARHMLHTLLALTTSVYNLYHFTHFLCIQWVVSYLFSSHKYKEIQHMLFLPAVSANMEKGKKNRKVLLKCRLSARHDGSHL